MCKFNSIQELVSYVEKEAQERASKFLSDLCDLSDQDEIR